MNRSMLDSALAWLAGQGRALWDAALPVLQAAGAWEWFEIGIWCGVTVMLLIPGATCLWMARRLGRIRYVSADRLEDAEARIANLSAALSLLTDTTEAAFRDVMEEIERQTRARNESPFDRRVSTTRRIGLAASNGRSAREIAVSEGVSEGEVRLRLRLAQHLEAVNAAHAVGE
jgi:hypothetical protein